LDKLKVLHMLQPRKVKYRKVQKGKIGKGIKEDFLCYGSFGLRALEYGRITAKQIESALKAINKEIKKQGYGRLAQVWIRIFPHTPVTEKPTEVRMGKGKGVPSYWVAKVKPGQILFEVSLGTTIDSNKNSNQASHYVLVKSLLKKGKIKLPINTIATPSLN